MSPFETLYGCFKVGEFSLIRPKLVHEDIEKVCLIRERLKMTQSRQKCYVDVKRKDLEFNVNDWVYLKIPLMKGVMRFGKNGNISTRYVGSYQIYRHSIKVDFEVELPN